MMSISAVVNLRLQWQLELACQSLECDVMGRPTQNSDEKKSKHMVLQLAQIQRSDEIAVES